MPPTTPATHKKSSLSAKLSYQTRSNGFEPWGNTSELTLLDQAEIWSISHGRGPYGHPFWDNGGFFFVKKSTQAHSTAQIPTDYRYGTFRGQVAMGAPVGLTFADLSLDHPSDFKIWGDGATLISRALPTAPDFSSATFLGELREGVPSLVGSSFYRTRTLELVRARSRAGATRPIIQGRRYTKDLGGEYLNVEFGWKPLVSDVLKFARTVKKSTEQIAAHDKYGKISVRRRRSLPGSKTTVINRNSVYPLPISAPVFWTNCETEITKEVNTWFSGDFRYYVNLGDTTRSRILDYEQRANMLLGTRLTPEVLWELAPWSWAIDWFTNAGDVMSNISALQSDRLAMHYGYVMCSSETTRKSSGTYDQWGRGSATYYTATKSRHFANPYGFNSTWEGMTPRQIAISTALGFSRVKR